MRYRSVKGGALPPTPEGTRASGAANAMYITLYGNVWCTVPFRDGSVKGGALPPTTEGLRVEHKVSAHAINIILHGEAGVRAEP